MVTETKKPVLDWRSGHCGLGNPDETHRACVGMVVEPVRVLVCVCQHHGCQSVLQYGDGMTVRCTLPAGHESEQRHRSRPLGEAAIVWGDVT